MKDLPIIIMRTLISTWLATSFHTCELFRKLYEENAIHQSYINFRNVTWSCDMVVLNLSDNLQAVFSCGASDVTPFSAPS